MNQSGKKSTLKIIGLLEEKQLKNNENTRERRERKEQKMVLKM